MGTSRFSRHRGRPRHHNPPPPTSSSARVPVPDIAPPKYRTWNIEIQDVAVFFAFGLRRQDFLNPHKGCGRMSIGGWEALTDLMNELIAINNYQYEPLQTRLLRNRFESSFKKIALNQLKMTSDLPITPSENWVRKEFLDIVLSYPTNVPESPVLGACTSASTTPDRCRMWGGLEIQGIKKATQAIKQHNDYNNGITSSPPLPSENFLKKAKFLPENQSTLETYNNFRAQGPDHRPATQQQVGQSQASALQPYGAQQAGGFMGGYSHGYASEQPPIYPTIYPDYLTQYQENQGSYSDSQSWAMQPSTSATQSYIGQPPGGNTGAHSYGYQSGQASQGGQDDQHYYYQGSGR